MRKLVRNLLWNLPWAGIVLAGGCFIWFLANYLMTRPYNDTFAVLATVALAISIFLVQILLARSDSQNILEAVTVSAYALSKSLASLGNRVDATIGDLQTHHDNSLNQHLDSVRLHLDQTAAKLEGEIKKLGGV